MLIVSSTVGWSTRTGWKRRSSAASFSMCLRYSSSVVAPMVCSSPRASIGLSRLEASIAPSAAPAPTTVWSSSMNRMTRPSASLISLRTAFSRSSNSPRNLAPAMSAPRSSDDDALVLQALGHVATDDPLGEALDDRRLADARLADQDRVVLGAPRQDLDDTPDLVVAPDDRVELAGARLGGQVAAVLLEGGVGAFRVLRGDALAAAHALEGLQDRFATAPHGARAAPGPRRRPRRWPAGGARSRRTRRRAAWPRPRHARSTRRARGSIVSEPPWIAGAPGEDRGELAAERRAGRRRAGAGSRPGCRHRARRAPTGCARRRGSGCRGAGRSPGRR